MLQWEVCVGYVDWQRQYLLCSVDQRCHGCVENDSLGEKEGKSVHVNDCLNTVFLFSIQV